MKNLNHSRTLAARLFAAALLLASSGSALADVHYVDVNSTNATPPYTNWATAATYIQAAVDTAVAGEEIVVTNGIYATGGRTIDGVTTNRVAVDKPLTRRSLNGPESTIINGGYSNRCVYLTNGASLSGFTLTDGSAQVGGGLWCESRNAVISNCVVSGNGALEGGGASGGTLNNCVISGNGVRFYAYVPRNQTFRFTVSGGGASGGTLNNCILSGNHAFAMVSGFGFGEAFALGGGAYWCIMNNCTLTGNDVGSLLGGDSNYGEAHGGGSFEGTLNNCTLTDNSTLNYSYFDSGGGAAGSYLNNCVVYSNNAWDGANYDSSSTLNYSCTTPQPTNGVGNITNAPLFVDQASGNLRLQSNSPCINAGNNDSVATSTDLDGNPRISGGIVDIGAYEFVFTPQMNLGRLILLVEAADLGAKHQQPLLATLNAALASLTRGSATAANQQLLAFQNQLRAQVAPWNPTMAEQWSAAAQQMIAAANGR